jgi:hypothetical protein
MIDNKLEYILCAALYYDDGVEYPHQPKNIKTGIVVCGRRHHNCFVILSRLLPDRIKANVQQGFVTSKDLYVSRETANEIALSIGQVKDNQHGDELISEDLY